MQSIKSKHKRNSTKNEQFSKVRAELREPTGVESRKKQIWRPSMQVLSNCGIIKPLTGRSFMGNQATLRDILDKYIRGIISAKEAEWRLYDLYGE